MFPVILESQITFSCRITGDIANSELFEPFGRQVL